MNAFCTYLLSEKYELTLKTILWNLMFLISNAHCTIPQVSLEIIHLDTCTIFHSRYKTLYPFIINCVQVFFLKWNHSFLPWTTDLFYFYRIKYQMRDYFYLTCTLVLWILPILSFPSFSRFLFKHYNVYVNSETAFLLFNSYPETWKFSPFVQWFVFVPQYVE